jgi:serine/threonine protein kinase
MSQAVTPAAGAKVGRYTLAAESAEALAAPSFIGRAEDGRLARVLLVPRAGTDAEAVQRAAAQAKNLTHENVIRFVDVESVDGRVAVAFEHAESVSVHSLAASAGAAGLERKVVLRIALDVLEGLAAAHAAGLAHGELGPHLVLVGTDGHARILGVGVAKTLGKALAPKTPSDRLAYIAPERVKAASAGSAPAADPKCDVFSAGILLWELFAHQRLFAGRLESAVIQKVLTAPVPPLAATSDDVPDAIDEALRKALDRDPARRMANVRELTQTLEAAFPEGAAKHEEVAAVVEELAKKSLGELRARLTAAGATSANGQVIMPPPRASFPTLDELWVIETPSEAPPLPVAALAAAKSLAAPAAPKQPPPKPLMKPVEAPATDAKADVKADVKAVDATAKAGPPPAPKVTPAAPKAAAIEPADAKPADAKPADAKPADAKPADAKPADAKPVDAKAAPAKTAAPSPGVKVAMPVPGVKRMPIAPPRKGTLLGMAAPTAEERAEAAAKFESERLAKLAAAEAPKPAEPADHAGATPADGAAPSSSKPATPKTVTPKPAEAASLADAKPDAALTAVEAKPEVTKPSGSFAAGLVEPTHAATPASKTPGELESTPSSTGSPMSLADRKRRAMQGNLKPGDTLGRYELLLPVASGGMASVWAARLQGTAGFQKIVAIKTMLQELSADVDFEEMFLDEARVAARIRHPNVVEIFDLGEEEETLYLVMEWVDGETLGAVQKGSKAHGGIPLPILLRLASQACAGLHAAHELRDDKGTLVDLVHRDISPANILVSRTGFVKIVDFGVAKSKARMYTTRVGGMIKGKTPYLSPEQLAGQQIDRRSDIYSFGAVLYVLATGLHPFRGETEAKTIENIALRDPVPLRKIDSSIHPELEAIVLKALDKDRDKRFESASEMQRAIDTLAASIGQTTTDDDVAAFVRKAVGDALEKRGTALREAIATADTGRKPIEPRQAPESVRMDAARAADAAKAAEAAKADAAKVEIDDVEIDTEEAAPAKTAPGEGQPPARGAPTLDPAKAKAKAEAAPAALSPFAVAPAVSPFTAPSLGSDAAPETPPVDTLAAASTEPGLDPELAPPRRRGPMIVVGSILGACALIVVIAFARSGGDKPSASSSGSGSSTGAVAAATNPELVRTADTPAVVMPPTAAATVEPAAAPSAAATEPAPTAEPAVTAEPSATAEPEAPPPTTKGTGKRPPVTKPVTKPPVTKPPVTKPPVTKPPVTKPPTTKPPTTKPFEPSGL